MKKDRAPKNKMAWGQRGEHLVAIQFLLMAIFVVLPVYPTIHTSELFHELTLLRWATLLVSWVAALLLGALGSRHIKEFLTPLPYPVDHNRLVTTGMYALVRHPLYSSQLFAAFGWTVFNASLSHLLVTIIALLFFSYKASREECWLTERHPEYVEYARKVKKFIPWIY